MPGGAAEDVPVCLVLGTATVTAIGKNKRKKEQGFVYLSVGVLLVGVLCVGFLSWTRLPQVSLLVCDR